MAGQLYKLDGAVTESRYVSQAVTAGQIVAPDTSAALDANGFRQVKPAAAGATAVSGVAMLSATNAALADNTFVHARTSTTIIRKGQARVVFAAACEEDTPLVVAANGAVTGYTAGTTTGDQIIGKCLQKVTAAGEGIALIDC